MSHVQKYLPFLLMKILFCYLNQFSLLWNSEDLNTELSISTWTLRIYTLLPFFNFFIYFIWERVRERTVAPTSSPLPLNLPHLKSRARNSLQLSHIWVSWINYLSRCLLLPRVRSSKKLDLRVELKLPPSNRECWHLNWCLNYLAKSSTKYISLFPIQGDKNSYLQN